MKILISFCFLAFVQNFSAQLSDTIDDKFVRVAEETLSAFYAEYAESGDLDSIIEEFRYDANEVPEFSDEVYCARLSKLDNMTDFELLCNEPSISIVKFFAEKRRNFVRVVMGRSELYFDMFEETLAKYDMPLELKYLAVIESGLRPQVRSRAGALGLWQFMYRTGKYMGLKENSYIDERMDPVKATDAACRYLKKLYGIYADWNLALAAYNAGPGNVNKAIRRSGGLTTYWGIRPFLPRETQGYVPNFIGAMYLMTYHKEHNIVPAPAKIHNAQLDTMCLRGGVTMSKISEVIGWDVDEIKALNPIYKASYIPRTDPPQCLTGPLETIGKLVSMEADLYVKPKPIVDSTNMADDEVGKIIRIDKPNDNNVVRHTVKRGESLGSISKLYGVTVSDIKRWNNLSSTRLLVGQKLKIGGDPGQEKPKPIVRYYTVRSGDNFSTIARRHGVTQTQLKKLNPGINVSKLRIGQRLRIR